MNYTLVKKDYYPAVVLQLKDVVETRSFQQALVDSTDLFQMIHGIACLIVDLNNVKAAQVEQMAYHLNAFERSSPTFKQDAPVFVALVGEGNIFHEMLHTLENLRFKIPAFHSYDEVLTYLTLKVQTGYVKQSLSHPETDELETLHVSGTSLWLPDIPTPTSQANSIFPDHGVLRLQNLSTNDSIVVRPKEEIIIGRRSQGHQKPTIDLTNWGAYQHGISRHHAKIVRDGRQLKLVDLGSPNGTYINGIRARSHIGILLHSGDDINFGELAMRITYEETS